MIKNKKNKTMYVKNQAEFLAQTESSINVTLVVMKEVVMWFLKGSKKLSLVHF